MRLSKENAQRIADLGVLALAFVLPSGFYFLDLPILVIIGICRILQRGVPLRSLLREPRIFLPIAFYLYIFFGFFFSHNTGEALSSWSEKLPWLLYPLIIGSAVDPDGKLRALALRAFVLSICLSMLGAFLYAGIDVLRTHTVTIQLGESIYNKYSWYGLTRVFDNWHPTNVAVFCNLAIAVLLHYAFEGQKWFFRKYGYLTSALIFLSLSVCALYSLTEIIVLIGVFLWFGIRWICRLRLSWLVKTGLGLGTSALLAGILYANPLAMDKIKKLRERGWQATDRQEDRNVLSMRLAKWETHLDIFWRRPVFGTTVGDIRDVRKETYVEKGYKDLANYNYNAHNEYLEVLATYGIAGSLIFFLILGVLCSRIRLNALITPFILIMFLAFTTECLLERQQGLNFFLFFYSLLTLPDVAGIRLKPRQD